jgi:hypothetical protein
MVSQAHAQSTRASSTRHLPTDKRERRLREVAALPGAGEPGGQAAPFVTDVKVAYDEPLTGDRHHGLAGTIAGGTGLAYDG